MECSILPLGMGRKCPKFPLGGAIIVLVGGKPMASHVLKIIGILTTNFGTHRWHPNC